MSEVRSIDANALKEALKSGCEICPDANTNWCEHCCKINDFEDLIDNAPTVAYPFKKFRTMFCGTCQAYMRIEPDRLKGEWIVIKSPLSNEVIVKCPYCKDEFIGNDVEDYNFCPVCGADMRKEAKNER